jgi:transposase
MRNDRRAFSVEFKREAIDLVRRSGKSANQVAKELGVNQTTLSRWKREAEVAVLTGPGFQAADELKQLRREVERLRMERDILKKAAVGSSGACNSCLQYSRRGLKTQRLPRTLVQAQRNRVQGCLRIA